VGSYLSYIDNYILTILVTRSKRELEKAQGRRQPRLQILWEKTPDLLLVTVKTRDPSVALTGDAVNLEIKEGESDPDGCMSLSCCPVTRLHGFVVMCRLIIFLQ